ncbi:hypothetical protein CERZMDRAFT_92000 [Cercospora zeae-maydis SCOH1-5]|uniref:Uncharacterized protein n=1 Tax=Cercospora zeae-maydis SCOH1-5 TaxID=717836 RepID=A0A6A6F1L7_9PEZI|nr:hypothetical protein CERZMDRAFT_92000 [Cercospora zeae-maydis SCOH1-5]
MRSQLRQCVDLSAGARAVQLCIMNQAECSGVALADRWQTDAPLLAIGTSPVGEETRSRL